MKYTAWATLSIIIPAMLASGCRPQETSGSQLPYHRLDLSAQPPAELSVPVVRHAPRRRTPRHRAPAGDAAWGAVRGHRAWRYIVIHHSATDGGSAAAFDQAHRNRGWDELGYHFVIDNGDGGPDGRVEVGSRWRSQKWGAHCKTPDNAYNDYGIGICLVGDFTDRMPSRAQLASLHRLVRYLATKYDIPPGNVVGHRDAPGTSTACPGRAFHPYIAAKLRSDVAHAIAAR